MNINTKTIKASIQSIGNSLVVYGFITSLFIKVKIKYFLFIVLAIIYNINIINPTININIANNGRFTLKALTSFVETDPDANDLVVFPLKLQRGVTIIRSDPINQIM